MLFELNWSDYQGTYSHQFFHSNKTQKEFEDDINYFLVKYGDEYIEQEDILISIPNWLSFIAKKLYLLGYEDVEKYVYDFHGGYIIERNRVDQKEFEDIIGEELIEKAIKLNESYRKIE